MIWITLTLLTVTGMLACQVQPAITQFAGGLNQPRGLIFDGAGNLIVAETGAPDPNYAGTIQPEINHSARILSFDPAGRQRVILDGLPYTRYVNAGDTGATDVALIDNTLYLLTGEGYDDAWSRSVLRVTQRTAGKGSAQRLANLLAFAQQAPINDSQTSIALSNPFAMVAAPDGSALYVTDGASGRVLRVTLDGQVDLWAELPELPPLTGLTFAADGALIFARFGRLPHTTGSGSLWRVDSAGQVNKLLGGFTMPIDLAFDAQQRLYVLEFSREAPTGFPYVADSGRLLRIERDGRRTVLLDKLNYPTAMAFAPGGDLYLTVGGAFVEPAAGAILRAPCASVQSCPTE